MQSKNRQATCKENKVKVFADPCGTFSSHAQSVDMQRAANNLCSDVSWNSTETRCGPRTRMRTHMVMVQMPIHIEMQPRKKLSWNKLFQQYCTFFPCYHTSGVDCGVWNGVECRVWTVKTVECWVGNVARGCEVGIPECKVPSIHSVMRGV